MSEKTATILLLGAILAALMAVPTAFVVIAFLP